MKEKKRPPVARGTKPNYFENPGIDRLVAICMGLAGEISVVRDRLDSHERLAGNKIWATAEALEAMQVSDEVAVQRQASRDEFVERIFRSVTEELDRVSTNPTEQSYSDIIDDLSK